MQFKSNAEPLGKEHEAGEFDDGDAEEGELPTEALPSHPEASRYPKDNIELYRGREGASRDSPPDDRWRPRSRSTTHSPGHRRHVGGRDRHQVNGRDRDQRRHSRSRSRDRRGRHGGDRRRGRSRSRSRDRSRDRGRRDRDEKGQQTQPVEEEENEEEYQQRVAAALAAQEEEDDEKLIQERRRRRQEILAKHKKQEVPNAAAASNIEKIESLKASQAAIVPSVRPSTPAEGTIEDQDEDEDAVMAELGTEEGGALDIWRHDGGAAPAGGVNSSAASVPASGIGEAHDAELDKRVQAAAHARGAAPLRMAAVKATQEKEEEEEEEDDMFAATPEDAKRGENVKGMPGGAAAGPRRGLVDSYDDAEGYYNFQVGEVIGGRFEVVQAHGRGVFSSVLRARDLSAFPPGGGGGGTGAPAPEVAVKVIRANETMYKAGQMEKVILHKLAQADPDGKRHCIRLLGSFEYRNHLCLVFEAMDMDLRGLTKRYGRGIGLSLSAVRIYAQQMLVALQHLRNCGVLHADIKPDNILVNERRTAVKLCDFGSAMFSGDNEITPYLVSRFYRSPEVILGLPYDHPMDMWSIGCVVYELFTGQILFPGKTNNEMLKLMMDVKGPFPKKMLKRAEFAFKHFESDPNMTFALLEEDTVTRRPVRRLLPNPSVKQDFAGLLAGQAPDRRKLGQLADLLERMMSLDPDKRLTPKEALVHPFIKEVPQAPRAVGVATGGGGGGGGAKK